MNLTHLYVLVQLHALQFVVDFELSILCNMIAHPIKLFYLIQVKPTLFYQIYSDVSAPLPKID